MNTKVNESLEYLDGVRAELYVALDGLTQDQLDFTPADGQWSAGEIFHHLYVVEKGLPKLYSLLLSKANEAGLKEGTPDADIVQSLDQFQLDVVKQKHKAPERVLPQAGVSKQELRSLLEGSRKAMHDVLDEVGEYDLSGVMWPHPALGDINFYQWILFVGKHEKRHMAQLAELRGASGFPA